VLNGYKKTNNLWIIEAKTGIPNFKNRQPIAKDKKDAYRVCLNSIDIPNPNKPLPEDNIHQFQMEILKKFNDTLLVYCGVLLQRAGTKSSLIKPKMRDLNRLKNNISLILIVKELDIKHTKDWQDIFNRFMEPLKKRFSIEHTLLLNEEMARKHSLIQ
jgi:hypothetical protein